MGLLTTPALLRGQSAGRATVDVTVPPFAADPSGRRNSTDAFRLASEAIMAAGGGDLIVPPGVYKVGKQSRARAAGQDWAYRPEPIIQLRGCAGTVNLIGEGAKLVCEEGLKFGAFDRARGSPHYPRLPFTERGFRATPYVAMIALYGNTGRVLVSGFELDGNIDRLAIGGHWNDAGIQINCSGIEAYNNEHLIIEGVSSHHHGLDGIMIGFEGLKVTDRLKPHSLSNCRLEYNGRQALSWVGGNALHARRCRFAKTGRAAIITSPGAGIDIEAEQSICRNGLFEDCEFVDNVGVGFVAHAPSDNADIVCRRCTFVGTSTWSAWPAAPGMEFEACLFVGGLTNAFAHGDPAKATRFLQCRFTADPRLSETGKVYRQNYSTVEIDGGENVLFDQCHFDSGGTMSSAGLAFINGPVILRNCQFVQGGEGLAVLRGIFEGRNEITTAGNVDMSGAILRAPVLLNGRTVRAG